MALTQFILQGVLERGVDWSPFIGTATSYNFLWIACLKEEWKTNGVLADSNGRNFFPQQPKKKFESRVWSFCLGEFRQVA